MWCVGIVSGSVEILPYDVGVYIYGVKNHNNEDNRKKLGQTIFSLYTKLPSIHLSLGFGL